MCRVGALDRIGNVIVLDWIMAEENSEIPGIRLGDRTEEEKR